MFELNKLYNLDCMEGMKTFPDKYFDLAIVDPPYGIGNNTITAGNKYKSRKYKKAKWNNNIPDENYFNELFRISKNQIIWGGNYFHLPLNRCYLIWYKEQTFERFSDLEYAWASFDKKPGWFHYQYTNIIGRDYIPIHPTQKPTKLYRWTLRKYAKPDFKIIDTHAGSCSSVIAFLDYGCDWIAFEIDKDYYEAASNRIENHKMQLRLI